MSPDLCVRSLGKDIYASIGVDNDGVALHVNDEFTVQWNNEQMEKLMHYWNDLRRVKMGSDDE